MSEQQEVFTLAPDQAILIAANSERTIDPVLFGARLLTILQHPECQIGVTISAPDASEPLWGCSLSALVGVNQDQVKLALIALIASDAVVQASDAILETLNMTTVQENEE